MKKLTLAAIVGLGLMSGSALAASAWTGGDDLPTNPLSCDATPAAAAAKPMTVAFPPTRLTARARRSPWSTCRS